MKVLFFCIIYSLLVSCQQKKTHYRFDKKSLSDVYRSKNFNLLILWDQRIQKHDGEKEHVHELKKYLSKTLEHNHARILIAGIDGNPPHYFLTSDTSELPSDFSPQFYSVEKLNLSQFQRHYNPNMSILKSARELIQNYTYKKFFIPENDFVIIVLSTQDDENYKSNMHGEKYQDQIESDIENMKRLNQRKWSVTDGEKREFSFVQLRIFVIAPTSSCHKNFASADKLFYASSKINAHFTQEEEEWKRDIESFDICNLNFKAYFDNIFRRIEDRYEIKL